MCTDHGVSRRQVFRGAGALAAAAALAARPPRALAAEQHPLPAGLRQARPVTFDGTSPVSNAMHIHSSFSEFYGSMAQHMYQANLTGVDVVWWTDHDWRMDARGYRTADHFTQPDVEAGGKWTWVPGHSGPVVTGSDVAKLVTSPVSPHDPHPGAGSLSVAVRSSTPGTPARSGCYCNSQPSDWNYRGTVDGLTIDLDVLLPAGWRRGYLEILIESSLHPAKGTAPAGEYSLSYRIGPGTAKPPAAHGTQGVIKLKPPGSAGQWGTVTIHPASDIATLWPSVDARDFAFYKLTLNAVSTGDAVSGYFSYLRFHRANSGSACFTDQQDMMAALASQYPAVTQLQGLEVSLKFPHVNWYGPGVTVPTYQGVTKAGYPAWVAGTLVRQVHSSGGLLSYNHPYGTSPHPAYPVATQDQMLAAAARDLLPGPGNNQTAVYGCDLLEVGYRLRHGVNLAHHVSLWDVFSRNAIFLTGTGTTDDHIGHNWHALQNNWITSTWSASTRMSDLLPALAAGRAYTGSLSTPAVALDMLVDGTVPMGAVSVSSVNSRSLTLTAAGLPTGWNVDLFQGRVDYAGTSGLQSNAKQVGSFGPGKLNGNGQAKVTVDTSAASYLRMQVVDRKGTVQGLSNPVWLLRKAPPGGIPGPRQA